MRYVEVTTQLFVFLFAQDHLGAHNGRQFERLPDHPGFPRIRRAPPASSSRHMPGCADRLVVEHEIFDRPWHAPMIPPIRAEVKPLALGGDDRGPLQALQLHHRVMWPLNRRALGFIIQTREDEK
jgi:hypothetical protein